ncbi:MAG: hypothetical protein ACYTAO_05955 [Planctomycetota bacterium]
MAKGKENLSRLVGWALAHQSEMVGRSPTPSKSSVDFFKKQARKHHTEYQKMIRRLLNLYVTHHPERKTN